MGSWNDEDLAEMAESSELRIAPMRDDGTLQRPRIIWVIRLDGDVYVRSVNGPDGEWFRGVQARHAGHISAGAVDAGPVTVVSRPGSPYDRLWNVQESDDVVVELEP